MRSVGRPRRARGRGGGRGASPRGGAPRPVAPVAGVVKVVHAQADDLTAVWAEDLGELVRER